MIASHISGFIGSNKLITVDIESSEDSIVTKSLYSADWGKDGQFVIADSSDVKILDESGRIKKKLKTPEMAAFFNASDPTFSPDGKFIVYNCGSGYYLHDLEKDEYKKVFSVKTATDTYPARISKDGRIIVIDSGEIFIYTLSDKSYEVYYDKAKSSYPNW